MPWSSGTYTKWNASNVPPNWVGDASVGIKIEASRHDTQDDDFATGINNCLTKDGQNTATANLPMGGFKHTNCANATSNTEYATYGQLLSIVPSGAITAYGASTAPSGWLLCNGSAISRTTYASLFAVISTTYGAGDGTTTFNLPDLQQKFPLGKAASGTGATLGGTGGTIDHTHSVPAHYHGVGTLTASGGTHGHGPGTLATTGGGHEHTQVKPNASNTVSGASPLTFSVWDNTLNGTQSTTGGGAHTHGFTGTVGGTDGSHGHTFSGNVGNTGGSNGDAALTSGTNNPPFLVVNYIIKT